MNLEERKLLEERKTRCVQLFLGVATLLGPTIAVLVEFFLNRF